MQVISLINGSLISRNASMYAINYAKELNYKILFVFIKNSKDDLLEVKELAGELIKKTEEAGIEGEFKIFDSIGEFEDYVKKSEIDLIFSSTKRRHSFFEKSFVKKLLKRDIRADFAIVKIVRLTENVEKLILPIKEARMSVKKFSFFVTLVSAYKAKGEIFSVEKVKPINYTTQVKKEKLQKLIFDFRHYFRLLKLMDKKISLKYANSIKESDKIKTHIVNGGFDLAIVGATTKKKELFKHPLHELFESPIINTIYFVPYEEEIL